SNDDDHRADANDEPELVALSLIVRCNPEPNDDQDRAGRPCSSFVRRLMNVQLPDGSVKDVPENATVADVAASIGKRLAKDAVAGKVNGKVVDVYAPVPDGAKVEIVTPKSEEGLDTIRHSTAHLMAMAVQELFPGTQVTIGPV